MCFIISSDTHGMIDIGKVVHFFNEHEGENTSNDYLIICGDVGVCGFSASEEAEVRNVLRSLPVTTLFVDGNHENFEQLNSYGVDTWNGGKVHFIESNIIHLMRGRSLKLTEQGSLHLAVPQALIKCIVQKGFRGSLRRYRLVKSMRRGGIILKKQIFMWIIF